jgi:hypothetical protein
MNRHEFAVAYREARKVRTFEMWAWRLGLIREVTSLAFSAPEPAFRAALMGEVDDPLRFTYIRVGGRLLPKLSPRFDRKRVPLPGGHA